MNGRKAKALRKIARQQTPGLPERIHQMDTKTGQIKLGVCTRKLYKELKKRFG